MRKHNIKTFGVYMAATAMLLCACGKKDKVDYDIVQSSSDAVEETAGNGVYSEVDTSANWSDAFDVSGSGSVIIDAEIEIPETESLSVVSVSYPEFDADYKKNMAKNVFGNNTVYVYGIEAPTKSDLEEELERLKRNIETNSENISQMEEQGYTADDEDNYLEYFKNEDEFYRTLIEKYEGMLETASDIRTATSDYSEYNFISERNGVDYILGFKDSNVASEDEYSGLKYLNSTRDTCIELSPCNYEDVCPEGMKGMGGDISCWSADEDTVENSCSTTKEDAELVAAQFVNSLGFSGYEVTESVPLAWYTAQEDEEYTNVLDAIDGYSVTFEPVINGISLRENLDRYYRYESDGNNYDLDSYLKVFVTDDGVIYMLAENPFLITDITDRVPVLPLNNIEDIMTETLKSDFDTIVSYSTGYSQRFKSLRLKYFRLKGDAADETSYSFVPVWELSDSETDMQFCVVVNAIDGSVIDIGKELYGNTN